MEVTGLSADTFWKGETEIRGFVTDGGKRYRVRILRKGSQIFDYSCSHVEMSGRRMKDCCVGCGNIVSESDLCVHGQMLLAEYMKKDREKNQRPVSTSQKIRFMVREYTNREVSRIMGAGEEGKVRLVPRLLLSRDQIKVRFFIGKEKLYQVKDLVTFSQAVEFERFVEYGKGLSFHHSLDAFEEACRPLVLLVLEMVGTYREHYAQLKRSTLELQPVLGELALGKAGRERFFSIMEGSEIECEDSWKVKRNLTVKRENPKFEMLVEKTGKDGVKLTVPKEIMAFPGEKCLFIADDTAMYRCDEEYTQALYVLMEYMVMGTDAEREVLINDRDMPLFYERVLKKLEVLKLLKIKDVDLEGYRPEELKVGFYFDSNGPKEVTLRPELSYGDYSFHPLDDENVPREICRDVPGEFRVSQLITRYFKYTEEETKNMVIRGDDAAVYQLVSSGMSQFMRLGEVFVSESFKKIKVLPPANVAVRVRATDGWLELDVDTGGIPKDELMAILSEYQAKKKFYRMKNGDFLTLGDDGLLTMSKLAQTLGVEKEFAMAETMKVPMYRAMFLDAALKEDRSVSFYRDQLFKAVVRGMKDVEDSEYEIPESLVPVLRSYQKVGYRWLKSLDAYGFGGILADEMGLGKTIQIIALLLDEKKRSGDVSLIVCPASLVYNWENEIHTFAPELVVKTLAGAQAEREGMLAELSREKFAGTDVVITSYDLLKRDLGFYLEQEFRFQIIDEAQYIKNAVTQAAKAVKVIRAKTKFALTGTPIENHLGELWSIFDYLMPGFLFTSQKFKKMFETPIVRDGDQEALSMLRKMTGPFLMRRLKKDVLKELPDKLETVLYSRMEGEQQTIYQANAALLKEKLLGSSDADYGKDRMQILAELMKLRQICCEPSLCFAKYKGGSAKLETCMELLENGTEAGHKILLFSQFTSMLDIIAKRLDKEKISYYMLTGATSKKDRMQMVSSFQKDDVKVFLISLKAGGTGLNLTAADIVIHYDPWWNVAAQNQATDRAHRIGQENQVTVFKLITKGTVEENILKLQEMKRELADTIVTEGTGAFSGLSKEDLLAMLDDY
ncbi:MAG: DEAD/DEAH box helicase [Lachnospiraceae bacterium]|nr:DEAD/DEAH box helicase [Lachnospiraceae bacterium]